MRYLDVLVPVKNEADNIEELVRRIHNSLTEAGISYGVIFIDDRSDDATVEVINRLAKKYPVKAYTKQGKKGKAYSILEGIRYSTADTLAMIDGDLQYPPEAIAEMYDKSVEHGVVVAKRQNYQDSNTRKVFSKTFKYLFGKLLFNFNCDVQSGLKLFKREIIEKVEEKDVSGWTLDIPLLHTAIEMGHTIGEVDIAFAKRQNGSSKVNTLFASAEIGSQALALKLRPKKIYQLKRDKVEMQGSGLSYNKKKFITHTTLHPDKSAIKVLSNSQKIWMWVLAFSLFGLLIWNFLIGLQAVVAVLSFIYFVDVLFNFYLIYKSLHQPPEITISSAELKKLKTKDLPLYTVLCPLYKEAAVLPLFLNSISKMDYPKNKLEVMLLLEEDDKETQLAASEMDMPDYVKVVVVPDSQPKTKPKACNYGLTQATGEYLVIYDAEDIPDPLQLKKAFLAFQKADSNVICLQAKLNYHNPYQNVLTRLFTAEYSLWFDVTLTGLQSISTTIPLGGTSNHFRTKDLLDLEGWDPFNVTEDCDLGIRLFHEGYKTAIIDSTTLEEANSNVLNWVRQRSRWIKGYMQTYLVHMRNPVDLIKQQGWHSFVFQLVIGGKIGFIFINPFLWVMTISYFVFRPIIGTAIESLYPVYIFYMAGFSLIFGNFLFMYYYMIGVAKREQWSLMKFVFLVPIYWLMVSWAGFIALYQLIVKPHYWEKTNHGLHLAKVTKKTPELINEVTEMIAVVAEPQSPKKEQSKFKKLLEGRKELLAGVFMIGATVVSHISNFAFNTFLGRSTTLEEFGILSLFSSFSFIAYIPMGAVATLITAKTAFLLGKYSKNHAFAYFKNTNRIAMFYAIGVTLIWILLTPLMANFFQVKSILPFLLFSPSWIVGVLNYNISGYFRGVFSFVKVGLLLVLNSIAKLLLAFGLVYFQLGEYLIFAITGSMIVELFFDYIFLRGIGSSNLDKKEARFDKTFFVSVFLSGISTVSFLAVDVILAKHYLSPTEAGQYGLLSLVGKITYFLTSLISPFIVPLVSRNKGAAKSGNSSFILLLLSTLVLASFSVVTLGVFGHLLVPILFGSKTVAILPYLFMYVLTIGMFSITHPLISYYQAKDDHSFAIGSFIVTLFQIILVWFFHESLSEFVDVMFVVSLLNLGFIGGFFLLKRFFPLELRNIQDFFSLVFSPIKNIPGPARDNHYRILIFNWRDTKHKWAGGAETYIHELAKRWVEKGHVVTIFSGNDGFNSRFETIDGVHVIRRGGTFTVYIWAILYYVLRLRGKYDVVIDSENGIPFFTPLFVRIPKFLLIHHIHQDVFLKHLFFPLGLIGLFLEMKAMPWVYKKQKIVTVSQSSKKQILKLKLGSEEEIEVIHPGVDLDKFLKSKKTKHPSFFYLGRLKPYKNIDIAIQAFAKVVEKNPSARFEIAGTGESQQYLEKLVKKLNLSDSVVFLGRISEDDKRRCLSNNWIMLQPSMIEGWGITVIEANASGTPVIASDVGGLRDSVVDAETGFLVKPRNIEELAEKMLTLIEQDRIRQKFSKKAYEWSKNFSWNTSSEMFFEKISETVKIEFSPITKIAKIGG